MAKSASQSAKSVGSLHVLGVLCGLTAGVWLGAAEAPTKLVNAGLSPFAVSLCMVAGVFVARWSIPTLLKGTTYVFSDLMQRKHLIVWALLGGALWAVANTLTVFAIRDVGLAIAFPMWNANSLIGLLWGRVLFRELDGADRGTITKVVLGTVCIVAGAILLGFSALHGGTHTGHNALGGILAAIGAALGWGTMYVPYRKAYLSGMNPLSFVTAFTVGELITMFILIWTLDGGSKSSAFHMANSGQFLFWLFLGGFVWIIGDMFQQFAAKYLGIGRGIPLSNTNQLWGLAWGALVFGELAGADFPHKMLVLGGSVVMIIGALFISTAKASAGEHSSRNEVLERECNKYDLDYNEVLLAQSGEEFDRSERRRWWDVVIVLAATGIFVYLGIHAVVPPLAMDFKWIAILGVVMLVSLITCGYRLYKQTRFS
ncbi:MAG: EamA family transporter [Acidobacteria bacterium]|nr:EamA family transporter [Acidobacteriota bacterium]